MATPEATTAATNAAPALPRLLTRGERECKARVA
jgi:hypothetical protein